MGQISARSVPGLPEIAPGADLIELLVGAGAGNFPKAGDVVVIAHKAVSKAEGRIVALADVTPSARAQELARELDQGAEPGAPPRSVDPRAVQVVLDESREIVRAANGVLIARTRHGFVCANAGVDRSNLADPGTLVLLPRDPDASARALRTRLRELTGVAPAVLIADSFGRAWRHGQTDVAIGCAGLTALEDWRGRPDRSDRELRATWIAVADQVTAAADLARSKDSGEPIVIVSGLGRHVTEPDGPGAAELLRPLSEDLFR